MSRYLSRSFLYTCAVTCLLHLRKRYQFSLSTTDRHYTDKKHHLSYKLHNNRWWAASCSDFDTHIHTHTPKFVNYHQVKIFSSLVIVVTVTYVIIPLSSENPSKKHHLWYFIVIIIVIVIIMVYYISKYVPIVLRPTNILFYININYTFKIAWCTCTMKYQMCV